MPRDRRSVNCGLRARRLPRQCWAAVFFLPLVACASAPQWQRAGASAYETQNDIEACWAAAKIEAPDLSVPGRPQFGTVQTPGVQGGRSTVVIPAPATGETQFFDAGVRQRQLSDDCMKARGYRAAER